MFASSSINTLIELFHNLPQSEQLAFISQVLTNNRQHSESFQPKSQSPDSIRFKDGVFCPHCGETRCSKFGFTRQGKQRYKCSGCKRTFTATTNTTLDYTKKDVEIWMKYIWCMANHMSIRKSAKACGINKSTSFEWRHKILDALKNRLYANKEKLSGIIEADETFFHLSFKGCRNIEAIAGRPAHKRGNAISKRGLSKEQVCVPSAIDSTNKAFAQIGKLGTANLSALTLTLGNRITPLSTLKSDCHSAYTHFCNRFNLNHMAFKPSKKSHPLPHINGYHSTLKRFMRPFNGVATKYLNNYLSWFNLFRQSEFKATSTDIIFSDDNIDRRKDMRWRNPVPIVA